MSDILFARAFFQHKDTKFSLGTKRLRKQASSIICEEELLRYRKRKALEFDAFLGEDSLGFVGVFDLAHFGDEVGELD